MNSKTYLELIDWLLMNGYSVLLKTDTEQNNNLLKTIHLRIFTLKEVEKKDGSQVKRQKGLFKDYYLTFDINDKSYLDEISSVLNQFIQTEIN